MELLLPTDARFSVPTQRKHRKPDGRPCRRSDTDISIYLTRSVSVINEYDMNLSSGRAVASPSKSFFSRLDLSFCCYGIITDETKNLVRHEPPQFLLCMYIGQFSGSSRLLEPYLHDLATGKISLNVLSTNPQPGRDVFRLFGRDTLVRYVASLQMSTCLNVATLILDQAPMRIIEFRQGRLYGIACCRLEKSLPNWSSSRERVADC